MTPLIPAAAYARISEKVERDKIADQFAQLERHAKARGYVIVAWFQDDGVSGLGHKLRPGFRKMLAALEEGTFQVIIATEEERLARNVPEKIELHAACEMAGVTWDTIRDGFVDPSTDSGEFMSTIRAAVGRIESKRKARRQLAANGERVADGLPVPGRRRFGYQPGNIQAEPQEAMAVQRLFAAFIDGQSIRSLAQSMDWPSRRVRDTLANPSYAGYVIRHGEQHEAHPSVARLIERDDFERVQALLSAPGRRTSPGAAPRHVLSGLARCGLCEGTLSFRNNYMCLGDLSHPTVRKEIAEDVVYRELSAALLFGKGDPTEPGTERVRAIDFRTAELVAIQRELLAGVTDYGLKMADVAPQMKKGQSELDALQAERDAIVSSSVRASLLANLRHDVFSGERVSLDAAAEAKAEIEKRVRDLDLDKRRDLVRSLLDIVVHPGRGADRIEIRHRTDVFDLEPVE